MKKYDFIQTVAIKTGVTQKQTEQVLQAICDTITNACIEEMDEVNIPGFGKFKPKVSAARIALNPKTQEKVNVPETRTLKCTPSYNLRKIVEQPKNKKVTKK